MKLNIMLIDDNKIDLFISQKIIEKAGINANVKTFSESKAALEILKVSFNNISQEISFIPDLIFVDINMPGMNGFSFLNEFNKLINVAKNDIKIYMLSSSTSPLDIDNAKNQTWCSGYISKPLTIENLNNIMSGIRPYLTEYDSLNDAV